MITRVQRKRTKGFRLPPDTVCVSRPSKLGNPFDWTDLVGRVGERVAKKNAVRFFRDAIAHPEKYPTTTIPSREVIRFALRNARHVACWCRLDEPCHGDVLIAIAGEP